jgi:microcystin-dependent protein
MPTPSPRLGLALPSQPDDFSTQDLRDNWSKIDAAPGTHICTSTTRPTWGVNQAGRQIFETNTGVTRSWTGAAWTVYGFEPGDLKWSGRTDPSEGWLPCDGRVLNRSTYSHLFAAVGTAHNVGGEAGTDFRIPNIIGKVLVGRHPTTGQPYNTIGQALGSTTSVINTNHLPQHTHVMNHSHTGSTGNADTNHRHYYDTGYSGGHSHIYDHPDGILLNVNEGGSTVLRNNFSNVSTGGDGGHGHAGHTYYQSQTDSGTYLHSHSVTVNAFNGSTGGGPGANTPLPIMQPSVTMNCFIKI